MVVLVLAAAMSLAAAAIIGGVVFVQKVMPLGETSARLSGAALLVGAVVAALV
jgi:predicted metal-binding membrane protein